MVHLSHQSQAAGLPRSVRIMPGRSALWAGMVVSLASAAVLGWLARTAPGPLPIALCWGAFGLSALAAAGCGLRLLIQLPIIEASELGIAVWLHGPYHRPFFVPWSHVRAVLLTQVRRADAPAGAAPRDALGIELNHDDRFRAFPPPANDEVPVDGTAHADLAWSSRSISGDLRHWVELLQAIRSEALTLK
jgi:hypothetical protein